MNRKRTVYFQRPRIQKKINTNFSSSDLLEFLENFSRKKYQDGQKALSE